MSSDTQLFLRWTLQAILNFQTFQMLRFLGLLRIWHFSNFFFTLSNLFAVETLGAELLNSVCG